MYLDSKGFEIEIGDVVDVPKPNKTDLHRCAFEGTVTNFRGDLIVVNDQDDNYFDIEPERVTLFD